MAVATNKRKETYICNGTGPYVINFPVNFDASGNAKNIQATITDSNGLDDPLTPTTEFTVSGLNVSTVNSYDNTNKITIYRDTPVLQDIDYEETGPFSPDVLEKQGLDHLVFISQERFEEIERILKAPITDPVLDLTIPNKADRAGHHLAFDAEGKPIPSTGIPDVPTTPFMETVLDDLSAAAARTTLGADWQTINIGTGDWPYTATLVHKNHFYGTTGAVDRVFNLPAASGSEDIVYVKKVDADSGDIDVTPNGTDKINGINAVWKINAQYQFVKLLDRASGEWDVLDCLGTYLEYEDTTDFIISSPQSGTPYNPTDHELSITPGIWDVDYYLNLYAEDAGSTWIYVLATLDTAFSAMSRRVCYEDVRGVTSGARYLNAPLGRRFQLTLAATTLYKLWVYALSSAGGALTAMNLGGGNAYTVIRARRIG